jgi:hypothetical protein
VPTMYLVWDRKERKIVGGPFTASADATSYASRVRAKNPETHGAKLLDTVSVTVP